MQQKEKKILDKKPKFCIEKCEKVPEKYRQIFALCGLNIDNFWIRRCPQDGLCGAHCVVQHAHLEEGLEAAKLLRRNINIKLVTHWEEYQDQFPFDVEGNEEWTETVGMETKTFKNRDEYKDFLLSKEAEGMWLTQTCLQVVADMYQAKVHTLEINVVGGRVRKGATDIEKEGNRVKARWTEIIPNPNFKGQGEFEDQVDDFFLLNSSLTHYDLLVHSESKLAEQGLVIKSKDTKYMEKDLKEVLLEKSADTTQTDASDTEEEDEHIHCAKGCPISKANTLEEEYWELKLAHDQLKEKYNMEKNEREEEDKKMKGKTTATKFRAEIRLLKSSYTAAIETVAEQTTKKEEALTMLKLLKDTEKAKSDLNMLEENPKIDNPAEEQEIGWTEVCRSKVKSNPISRTFICEKCEETFSSEKMLKKHTMKHIVRKEVLTDTQPERSDAKNPKKKYEYNCEQCEKICNSTYDLRRHMHTHHEPIVCYLCDEVIKSRYELMKHKEVSHKITKLMTCKFFLENRCFNKDDCLYSHKKPNESPNKNNTNKLESIKTNRQIVCKKGKKCDQKCDYPENAHMHIGDVRCHFQDKCTKEKCPFKHIKEHVSFLEVGPKKNRTS